jgi:hypothetical protein
MPEEKKILDPDWMEPDKADWETKIKPLDDGANPRLLFKINASAKVPFYAILEGSGMPPLAVCIVQATPDIVALGVLEKLKIMVHQIQTKFNTVAKLTQGIRGVDLAKLPPINGRH